MQLAIVLEYMSTLNIVHRDLSLSNVYVQSEKRPLVRSTSPLLMSLTQWSVEASRQ